METLAARRHILAEFIAEALDHVDATEAVLIAAETRGLDPAAQAEIMRAMHTIKGGAAFLALTSIQELSHALETAVQRLGTGTDDREQLSILFAALDSLRRQLAQPDDVDCTPPDLLHALEEVVSTSNKPAPIRPSPLEAAFLGVARHKLEALRAVATRLTDDPTDAEAQVTGHAIVEALRSAAEYAGRHDMTAILPSAEVSMHDNPEWLSQLRTRLESCLIPTELGTNAPGDTLSSDCAPLADRQASRLAIGVEPYVRVPLARVDALVNQAGELVAARNRLHLLVQSLDATTVDEHLHATARALAFEMGRLVANLQSSAQSLRLVDVSTVFQRLPRVARDIALRTNKRVNLELLGGETEIDKGVAELIADPLLHMLRNAIDHGIESPSVRAGAGKDQIGTVHVQAGRTGGQVVISMRDDGAGIDVQAVRNKAVARGILSDDEAADLTTERAYKLLFGPGFSTATSTTTVSGRGVGLDIVDVNVRRLGGEVVVTSERGRFTTIELRLPIRVSSRDVLLVQAGADQFAIPLDSVRQTLSMPARRSASRVSIPPAIVIQGDVMPLVTLASLVGNPQPASPAQTYEVVVLSIQEGNIGLVVDSIGSRQQVIMKALDSRLASDGIGAAAILADGQVVLVIDPESMVNERVHSALGPFGAA